MLSKLIKHEFRATARFMGPGILILLAFALASRLSLGGMINSGNDLLALIGGLLLTGYIFLIIGISIAGYIYFIVRFCTNLMGREGYLMFTLPVSVHQQVWSKVITATVWMALAGLSIMLSVGMLFMGQIPVVEYLGTIFDWLRTMLHDLRLDSMLLGVSTLVLSVLTVMTGFLRFYAVLSIGCSFTHHKAVFTVLVLLAVQFISGLLGAALPFSAVVNGNALMENLVNNAQLAGTVWATMLYNYAKVLIQGAVYYLLTTWFLKHRLNLE